MQTMIRKHGVCLYIKDNMKYIDIEIGWQNIAAVHLLSMICGFCQCTVLLLIVIRKMHC